MKKTTLIIAILLLSFIAGVRSQTTGKASYYANSLHLGPTTSGIPYNKDSFTCAHRKFPFGTLVKVRNLRNDKEVIVKVTDRGPFIKGRIIDLSYVAAKKLGFIGQGIAKVEIINLNKDEETLKKFFSQNSASETDLPRPLIQSLPPDTLYLRLDNTRIKIQDIDFHTKWKATFVK